MEPSPDSVSNIGCRTIQGSGILVSYVVHAQKEVGVQLAQYLQRQIRLMPLYSDRRCVVCPANLGILTGKVGVDVTGCRHTSNVAGKKQMVQADAAEAINR
jgi:hypothetical protein